MRKLSLRPPTGAALLKSFAMQQNAVDEPQKNYLVNLQMDRNVILCS